MSWQVKFDEAWERCTSLQEGTTKQAARSWYTKGRVAESVPWEVMRDELLNADANVLDNDQINYVLGIVDSYIPALAPKGATND